MSGSELKLHEPKNLPESRPDLHGHAEQPFAPTCTGLDARVTSQLTSQNSLPDRKASHTGSVTVTFVRHSAFLGTMGSSASRLFPNNLLHLVSTGNCAGREFPPEFTSLSPGGWHFLVWVPSAQTRNLNFEPPMLDLPVSPIEKGWPVM